MDNTKDAKRLAWPRETPRSTGMIQSCVMSWYRHSRHPQGGKERAPGRQILRRGLCFPLWEARTTNEVSEGMGRCTFTVLEKLERHKILDVRYGVANPLNASLNVVSIPAGSED